MWNDIFLYVLEVFPVVLYLCMYNYVVYSQLKK